MLRHSWPDLIIGIDLGTTGTSVAFAKPTTDIVEQFQTWPNDPADRPSPKVPSIVAINGQSVEQWGFSVFEFGPEVLSTCNIYRQFKQQFDHTDSEIVIQAELAITLYLREIHSHLKKALQSQLPRSSNWDEAYIRFVFSYPTTWDDDTLKRFRQIIEEAGFQSSGKHSCDVTLNEADASIMHQMRAASKSDRPKAGDVVLLADIGGGTADVAILKVASVEGHDAKLDMLANGRGTHTGATHIDEAFRDKLRKELTPRYKGTLEQRRGQAVANDSEALGKLIDAAVFNIDQQQDYLRQKKNYGAGQINGRLQKKSFELLFNDVYVESEYCGSSSSSAFRMQFDKDDYFWQAFDLQVNAIWSICEEQLQHLNGVRIDRIVLGGGFSQSPFVQHFLKEKFSEYGMSRQAKVKLIEDYSVAVSQGLVHNELRETYGNSVWWYPAEATYGIRQGLDRPELIMEKGERIKVPHEVEVKHVVKIKPGMDPSEVHRSINLSLVFNNDQRPSDREGKRKWFDNFREVDGQPEFKRWIESSLPKDLKPRNRLFARGDILLVIKAKMARNMIVLSLTYNGVESVQRPLALPERWHDTPKPSRGMLVGPITWKFGRGEIQAIVSGLGIIASIVSLVLGGPIFPGILGGGS